MANIKPRYHTSAFAKKKKFKKKWIYSILLFSQNRAMELTFTGSATGVSWISSRFQMQILNVAKTTEHQLKFQIITATILFLPICESSLLIYQSHYHKRDLLIQQLVTRRQYKYFIMYFFSQNERLVLTLSSHLAYIFTQV